jgi:hypothetical protein
MNSFPKSRSRQFLSLLCSTVLISGAIALPTPATLAQTAGDSSLIEPLPLPIDRELSPKAAQILLQRVAQDQRLSPSQLTITAVTSATFDGCLGIYRPNQFCTMIAFLGWKVAVTSPQRTYVYHLTQDAAQIAYNATASGAQLPIRVSFAGMDDQSFLEPQVIFQSSAPGRAIDSTLTITLYEDGKVTEWLTAPYIKSAPILRKTLKPEQIAAFKLALENRRFYNLNGVNYLSAGIVPVKPTTYAGSYGNTQFARSEKTRLPRSLQQVITTWENLVR